MNFPKVFIIIVNWNGVQDTIDCLESVLELHYPNVEVIVVDNGSTDKSAKVIREKCPQITLIENKDNLGYTGGNNIGMQYAMDHGADYIWLLNNDIVVEPDTLSKLIETAELNSKIGLISPSIYYYDKPGKIQFCGSYVDWENSEILYPEENNLQIHNDFKNAKNTCLWGTALLIKKSLFEKIGYLNERFFAYWEDTEYSLRSIKAGFINCVHLFSKVYHKNQSFEEEGIRRPNYYYYFIFRNQYFLWIQYQKGFKKLKYSKKYFAKVIGNAANYRLYLGEGPADACLNGGWSAIRGVGGALDKNEKLPFIFKKVFLWHPYFWESLLNGDYLNILSQSKKRIKLKFMGMFNNI